MAKLAIATIKSTIKTILDTANDLEADRDLSANLTQRVKKVMKLNPENIPIQPSYMPAVTIFTDSKDISMEGIAKNQRTLRSAELSLKIVGIMFQPLTVDVTQDVADDEIEYLMENIEDILRDNPTIGGYANWSAPTGITYHNVTLDEETHLRAGIMDFEMKIYY